MPPPVVTGISPKEGTPGTKVTIRGEFLGTSPQDLYGLTICGVDCLLSAEWKSPSKIIARSGPGKGKGEVIATTKSGGVGTCTVQFVGYLENVGPLKESAVWVDESYLLNLQWGRKQATSPSQLHQDNPLGLSDEGNEKKFPEDELIELFADGSGKLSSENFIPAWFLLENHNGATFDDLKAGLSSLKRRVTSQKEGELSFLKSNVGSVMDQLETLTGLRKAVVKDKIDHKADMTSNIVSSIQAARGEADMLFQDVLGRKDKADATRNALSVLQRFKFLFNLPINIERNIQKGDYDMVINDYSRAKSLFAMTEVQVFNKVFAEVDQRIEGFREFLTERLIELPLTLEEQKRIIRHLISLESPGDPAWDCITYQYQYTLEQLTQCRDTFLAQESSGTPRTKGYIPSAPTRYNKNESMTWSFSSVDQWQVKAPQRVLFVEELAQLMAEICPDLWKLGQAYFTGGLDVRESTDRSSKLASTRPGSFRAMMLETMRNFSQLVHEAILPDDNQELTNGNQWSVKSKELIPAWLPQCVRYVRSCYQSLLQLDLPGEALDIVQQLTFDLRVQTMRNMFKQATEDIRNLSQRETWTVEVNDERGGTTQLPILFENLVVETLQLIKETVLQPGDREAELFDVNGVDNETVRLSQEMLNGFVYSLDVLSTQEAANNQTADKTKTAPLKFSNSPSKEEKLLVILSNCNFTISNVIPHISSAFLRNGFRDSNLIVVSTISLLEELDSRLFLAYLELKSDPIVGIIEQGMYVSKFDWLSCLKPVGVKTYIKEIIMDIIAVHAQVYAINPIFVHRVLSKIVESVCDEIARLYSCVQRFNKYGGLQARLDVMAFLETIAAYTTSASRASLKEARDCLPPALDMNDKKLIEESLAKFRSQMKFQLICFQTEFKENTSL